MRSPIECGAAIFRAAVVLLTISGSASAQDEIIALHFEQPVASDSDTSRTLQSLVKVQGTGQFCQDGLYLMTHYGDREEIFLRENQKAIDHPFIDQTWRHCSLFAVTTGDSVIVGRNWDNQNVGSIIVSLYLPAGGHASISFTRSIDLGFGLKDLEGHKSSPFGSKLLLAPFYAFDGINEHGLAASVAGVRQTTHDPDSNKKPVFVPFLLRKILDQARSTEEAVDLVKAFVPFDLDRTSLNTHFFVVDSSGRSVALEYGEDQWKETYGDKAWQALTNKPVFGVPDAELRDRCWRYRSISQTLETSDGSVDWKAGMGILRDVAQKGTTWSVVYSPTTKGLYLSVYQKWDTVYHLEIPQIDAFR